MIIFSLILLAFTSKSANPKTKKVSKKETSTQTITSEDKKEEVTKDKLALLGIQYDDQTKEYCAIVENLSGIKALDLDLVSAEKEGVTWSLVKTFKPTDKSVVKKEGEKYTIILPNDISTKNNFFAIRANYDQVNKGYTQTFFRNDKEYSMTKNSSYKLLYIIGGAILIGILLLSIIACFCNCK